MVREREGEGEGGEGEGRGRGEGGGEGERERVGGWADGWMGIIFVCVAVFISVYVRAHGSIG